MDKAWTPRSRDAGQAMSQIIESFAGCVKTLTEQAKQVQDEAGLHRLEEQVREEG